MLIWAPVLAVGCGTAALLRIGAHRCGHWAANRSVHRLINSLRNETGKPPAFILYLRPHWLDGHNGLINPYYSENRFSSGYWFHVRSISFDHLLSLELDLTVAALGTREMRISTGSVQVPDTEWKVLASMLIHRATGIVIVPGATEGLLWEIGEISRQCRESSVVLMQPPEFIGSGTRLENQDSVGSNSDTLGNLPPQNIKTFWQSIRVSLESKHGLTLMPYDESGSITPLKNPCDPAAKWCVTRLSTAFARYSRGTKLRRAESELSGTSNSELQLLSELQTTHPMTAPATQSELASQPWLASDALAPNSSFVSGSHTAWFRPHRGWLIVTFGLFSCMCLPLGLVAAVLGVADLREMRSGAMDPNGKYTTVVGMATGIMSLALIVVALFKLWWFP